MTRAFILGNEEKSLREESVRGLLFRTRRGLRTADRALMEALPLAAPRRILVGLDSEGALALAARAVHPSSAVVSFHPDAYVEARVKETLDRNGVDSGITRISPDLPGFGGRDPAAAGEPFDVVALPFPEGGDALLAREWIEEAHDILVPGGLLIAGTDGRATWLSGVVKEIFGRAETEPMARGAVVRAARRRTETRWKDHAHTRRAEFFGRTFAFETRAGVFSYGKLDPGSKALIATAEIREADRVLDVGCGYGILGIVAAARAARGRALLVDASARAVDLARRNIAANGLSNATAELRPDPENCPAEAFDVVLANPPYFSNFRIAGAFIAAAARGLAAGGRLYLVAKAAEAHADLTRRLLPRVRVVDRAGYGIIAAVKSGPGR